MKEQCPTCGKAKTRTLDQNDRMWAMLRELEPVNWHGHFLKDYEWKDVLTAGLKRQKIVPGIDGGFVVIGSSTRRMTKLEVSELMELIAAFGTEHGVTFKDAA